MKSSWFQLPKLWYSHSITKRYSDIHVMINTPVELTLQQIDQYDDFAESLCREALQRGYTGLNMNGLTCLPQVVDKAHADGLTVWVYTVDENEHMERFGWESMPSLRGNRKSLFKFLQNAQTFE